MCSQPIVHSNHIVSPSAVYLSHVFLILALWSLPLSSPFILPLSALLSILFHILFILPQPCDGSADTKLRPEPAAACACCEPPAEGPQHRGGSHHVGEGWLSCSHHNIGQGHRGWAPRGHSSTAVGYYLQVSGLCCYGSCCPGVETVTCVCLRHHCWLVFLGGCAYENFLIFTMFCQLWLILPL